MQPRITGEMQIILAGMSFFGDPFESRPGWDEENEIGRLWARFIAFVPSLPVGFFVRPDTAYEVHLATSETVQKGSFEFFVGMEADLKKIEATPIDLCLKVLPPVCYAVFTFQGEAIASDWEMDIQKWLRTHEYRSAHAYNFQLYDSRFKGMDRLPESTIDVYVPIENLS
jgi:predicted transcriptional regulator YdeE